MPATHNIFTTVGTTAGGDKAVTANPGKVYWIAASAGATGGSFQISDAADDSNDVFDIAMPANSVQHFNFGDAPIECHTAIYLDIPGTNLTVTIGHTST